MTTEVKTTVHPDGRVEITTSLPYEVGAGHFSQLIVRTEEKHIHDALVRLGWMPPEEVAALMEELREQGGREE